jgi:precorrin-2/cobalt-factor-2 C20-methyltransferase
VRPGRLIGVGVGPGDPELMTLKAARAIERAAVLAFIGARGRASRARQVAAGHVRPGTRELAFAMPMTGEADDTAPIYDAMARAIASELEHGRDVCFLCEGDPLFYGSFAYLLERLRGRFACVAIPGVPSFAAAAALALRPVALKDAALLVLPATLPAPALAARLRGATDVVIIKVGRHLAKVRAALAMEGLMDGALLIENVGLAEERTRPLAAVGAEASPYFALILARRGEPA